METTDDDAGEGSPVRFSWVRRHPVLTSVVSIALLFLVDISLLPIPTLLSLKTERPVLTAFQRADRDRQEKEGLSPSISKQWVGYSDIPKHLVRAVLVSEDASFWQHSGFDAFEIHRSITEAMSEGKDLRGASTITQQLVKNLFLSPSRNPLRKYHEVILTVIAELSLGKRRILELYLNEIEWGRGIYGVEAASRYHFGKHASEISVREAAFLAAIIPSPTRYTPSTSTDYLDRKVQRILRLMGGQEAPAVPGALPAQVERTDTIRSVPQQADTSGSIPE